MESSDKPKPRDAYGLLLRLGIRSPLGVTGLVLFAVAIGVALDRGQWVPAIVIFAAGAIIYLRLGAVIYLLVVAIKRHRRDPGNWRP